MLWCCCKPLLITYFNLRWKMLEVWFFNPDDHPRPAGQSHRHPPQQPRRIFSGFALDGREGSRPWRVVNGRDGRSFRSFARD